MITYQIQVPESSQQAFVELLKSLRQLGVVDSYRASANLVQPGEPLDLQQLMALLNESEQQAAEGLTVPAGEAAAFLALWKRKRK